jgi:hypothetical protein
MVCFKVTTHVLLWTGGKRRNVSWDPVVEPKTEK